MFAKWLKAAAVGVLLVGVFSAPAAAQKTKLTIYTALEKSLPVELDPADARLLRAFLQRYERLVAASSRLSLERLCERIVSEHDYDLVLIDCAPSLNAPAARLLPPLPSRHRSPQAGRGLLAQWAHDVGSGL